MARPSPQSRTRNAYLRTDAPVRRRLPRTAWIVGCVLVVAVAAGSMLGRDGLPTFKQLRAERRDLEADVRELRAREAALTADLESLDSDPATLERVARDEHGMVYPGETVVHVLDEETPRERGEKPSASP